MVLIVLITPPPCHQGFRRFTFLVLGDMGFTTECLRTEELAHESLTEMVVTRSMHERKIEMSRRADAFAVLPGGFGTMDEFFEILTWKQLGLHAKPIVGANTGGWVDPILSFFPHPQTPPCPDVGPKAPIPGPPPPPGKAAG